MIINREISGIWKNCLEVLKKLDIYYPTSCDAIARMMLRDLLYAGHLEGYDAWYVRGHYVPCIEDIECEYGEFSYSDFKGQSLNDLIENKKNGTIHDCADCTCSDVMQHSYIELLKDSKRYLLDFSEYQFKDGFNSSFDVDPEKLMSMTNPLIEETDARFERYVPTQRVVNIIDIDSIIR